MRCPRCGTLLGTTLKPCPVCGWKLPNPDLFPTPQQKKVKKCPICGATKVSKFPFHRCPVCGTRV